MQIYTNQKGQVPAVEIEFRFGCRLAVIAYIVQLAFLTPCDQALSA